MACSGPYARGRCGTGCECWSCCKCCPPPLCPSVQFVFKASKCGAPTCPSSSNTSSSTNSSSTGYDPYRCYYEWSVSGNQWEYVGGGTAGGCDCNALTPQDIGFEEGQQAEVPCPGGCLWTWTGTEWSFTSQVENCSCDTNSPPPSPGTTPGEIQATDCMAVDEE